SNALIISAPEMGLRWSGRLIVHVSTWSARSISNTSVMEQVPPRVRGPGQRSACLTPGSFEHPEHELGAEHQRDADRQDRAREGQSAAEHLPRNPAGHARDDEDVEPHRWAHHADLGQQYHEDAEPD